MILERTILTRFVRSENTLRRTLMVLLAFLMTHVISYQRLPFTADYQFPLVPFTVIVIYGLFICEANTWNYRRTAGRDTFRKYHPGSVWPVFRLNLLTCIGIFTVLTILQMLIFNFIMNPFRFVGLLAVCLMISMIETSVFLFHGMAKRKNQPITLNRLAGKTGTNELTILRNNLLTKYRESEIDFLKHQDGCVFLVTTSGEKIVTQFESLSEVEQQLSQDFFRANRQILTSRRSIQAMQKDINGKLKLLLNNTSEPVTVSRYRSRDLKDWYRS